MTEFSEGFVTALACPRCDGGLGASSDGLRCGACQVDFPTVGGVPWLFAEPLAALADWRQRAGFAIERLQELERQATTALSKSIASELTRQRIANERDGYREQRSALEDLLEPLLGSTGRLDYPTHLGLRTRLPADQGLNTYLPNLFRDWVWGDDENRATEALALDALGERRHGVRRMLVLGAGGARLAHDLTLRLEPEIAVAVDFNPLLLLAARRLTAGDKLAMTEFPLAPRRLNDHVVTRELAAEKPSTLGYVFGDVLRAPFRAGQFDLVVTPWLIDVVNDPLARFVARVNALLAIGGTWLNVGSLAFRTANTIDNLSFDETMETIATAGFARPDIVERELPYMRSPSSRHARQELVLASAAEKRSEAKAPPRYRSLPDWIVTGKAAVPASDSFRMQAASTRIHAFIMSLIDGRRSLDDMATIMEQRGLMPADAARDAIRGFLIKMYDDAQRYAAL